MEESPTLRAKIAAFFNQFRQCRNSTETLLKLRFFCARTELATLKEAIASKEGDQKILEERSSELQASLEAMPKGHTPIFVLNLLWFMVCLLLLNVFYVQISHIIEINWENNSEYLMHYRGVAVWCWQKWQVVSANNFGIVASAIFMAGLYFIQSRMLWFKAYVFILLAGFMSTLSFFWLIFSVGRLCFGTLM